MPNKILRRCTSTYAPASQSRNAAALFQRKRSTALVHAAAVAAVAGTWLVLPVSAIAQAPSLLPQADQAIGVERSEENWLSSQVRMFRSYPHLDLAYRLLDAGKPQEALNELESYLRLNPRDPEARIAHLFVLYRLHRHQQVVDEATIMVAERPNWSLPRIYRALAFRALGRSDAAVADLSEAASGKGESEKDTQAALGVMVDFALAAQDYRMARTAFERLSKSPQDFRFHIRRGLIAEGEGRLGDAKASFQQALAKASDADEQLAALKAIAENARKRKDYDMSRQTLLRALEIAPNDVQLMRNLASLAYTQNDRAAAEMWTRRVLQTRPEPVDREFLANVLFEDGRYNDALTEYERSLSEIKDNEARFRVYRAIGYTRQAKGEPLEAADAFRAALQIRADPTITLALAESMRAAGDTPGAIATLSEASEATPSGDINARLGYLYAQIGDHQHALQQFEIARRDRVLSNADRYQVEMASGYSAQALGRNEDAVNAFRAAVTFRPDSATRLVLAQALDDAGRTREAAAVLQTALAEQPSIAIRERLGLLYAKLGEDQRAADQLAVAARDPALDASQRHRLEMARGFALMNLGRNREAVVAFRSAAAIRPDTMTMLALAQALETSNQLREATRVIEDMTSRGTSPEIDARLGLLYAKQGDEARALRHLRDAGEGDLQLAAPERSRVLMARGFGYMQLRRYDEAINVFSAAAEINSDPSTMLALAQAYEAAGQTDRAISALRPVLQQTGSDEVRLRLALLELKAGNENRARALLTEASRGNLPTTRRWLALVQLGYLYQRQGNEAEARAAFEKAVALSPDDAALQSALGETYFATGALNEAIRAFERSAALQATPSRSRSLATVYERAGNDPAAIDIYRRLLASGGLPSSERAQTWASLGYAYVRTGKDNEAAAAFREALAAGADERTMRLQLGASLSKLKQWRPALEQFLKADKIERTPQTLQLIGRAYAALGDDNKAFEYFAQALEQQDRLTPQERRDLLEEVGFLYAQKGEKSRAIATWKQSMNIEYNARTALALGRAQRMAGDNEAAKETLLAIPAFVLPPSQQAERLDELARVFAELNDLQEAIDAQTQALDLQQTAEREYQLAAYYRQLGKTDEALVHYRAATALEPQNAQYGRDLGYAYLAAGQKKKGRAVFEGISAANPDDSGAAKQLGYLQLKEGETEAAIESLRRAIDGLLASPAPATPAEDLARRREIEDLRRETAYVNRSFTATGYQQYRSNTSNQRGDTPAVQGSIQSNGGVELAYRPPKIGFVDDRILEVFTRFLWANEPDALGIDEDSWQGGVGIRYKPLKTQNLYLSAEKLFRIGDSSDNNTLLRAQYGWDTGSDIRIGERAYNYTSLYTDVGYFAETTTNTVFYGEGRQGITFNIGDRLTVSPHLIIDGRTQYRDSDELSYVEAGAGVAVRLPFNDSKYESYRSSLEGVIQYRQSIDNSQSGLVCTGIFLF